MSQSTTTAAATTTATAVDLPLGQLSRLHRCARWLRRLIFSSRKIDVGGSSEYEITSTEMLLLFDLNLSTMKRINVISQK